MPATALAGADLVNARSALVTTVVVDVDESLPEAGSAVEVDVIVAVLVMVEAGSSDGEVATTIVNDSVAPLASPEEEHVTTPAASEHPAEADTKVVPAGSESSTV